MGPAAVVAQAEGPPPFVRLAAHALRWRLLRELTRSDRAVRELTERVGEPQNLVSYHLRRLRAGGLVNARRSAADRRDTYYAIDFLECERQLHETGAALLPALRLLPGPSSLAAAPRRRGRARVLFLCTGNSARSQMAEALLEHLSGGTVEAASAASHPKPLHPNAIRVMRTRGLDISGKRSKHLEELAARRFDSVITLCDRIREVCPDFPWHPEVAHWSIPDPTGAGSTARASYPAFERTAAELETRIRFLLRGLSGPSAGDKTRRSSRVEC